MEFAFNHGEVVDAEGARSYIGEQELRCIACAQHVELHDGKFTHGERVCELNLGVKLFQICKQCDRKFPIAAKKIYFEPVAKPQKFNWAEVDRAEYLVCFKQKKKKKKLQVMRSSKTICDECKDLVLDFGKYKGEYLDDVFDKDPGYVLWLRDRCRRRKNSEIGAFCETAFDGVCEKCFEPHGHRQKWKTLCRECYFAQ